MTEAASVHVEHVMQLVTGGAMSQAVAVAAELGIAEHLSVGPKHAAEIARDAGCHTPSLQRLLRALASVGLCTEGADGAFALTQSGALLRADAPQSLRHWAVWWGQHLWFEWAHLLHSVRTGESARQLIRGTAAMEHLEHDTQAAAIFDQAMAELTRLVTRSVVRAHDFSTVERVVDVGGGYGELLGSLLQAHPRLRGVLFDRPHAIARAQAHLESAGVADRCEIAVGSFFDAVPAGADAYLLKSVIHDWDDAQSAAILSNCRRAMRRDGLLVLVEVVMPQRVEASAAHRDLARRDLSMLIGPGGKERTALEFENLLASAGFRMRSVVPAALRHCVISAVPD